MTARKSNRRTTLLPGRDDDRTGGGSSQSPPVPGPRPGSSDNIIEIVDAPMEAPKTGEPIAADLDKREGTVALLHGRAGTVTAPLAIAVHPSGEADGQEGGRPNLHSRLSAGTVPVDRTIPISQRRRMAVLTRMIGFDGAMGFLVAAQALWSPAAARGTLWLPATFLALGIVASWILIVGWYWVERVEADEERAETAAQEIRRLAREQAAIIQAKRPPFTAHDLIALGPADGSWGSDLVDAPVAMPKQRRRKARAKKSAKAMEAA